MPLLIQTTGLEQYAPGGQARVKVMMIGGPGAGKTRVSSFYPKPIYADCEKGLASVADRQVPYVSIRNSADMLDLLTHLKQECRQPPEQRKFETVVIDTLDAYQRKVKNEWMEANRKEQFSGWEAWGFLNAKMQLLMVRLLNLDMNVIVNVHYKDKTTKDDETGRETHELMLQLQGETADTAFNDFDLVGWMGTYWEAKDGERVQKRGLTFRPTPDKPFLKDRLHVTPPWLEVTFADSDYTQLFERIQAKIESIETGEVIGEIASAVPEQPANVVAPGAVRTGALPPQPAKDVPMAQLDRTSLLQKARQAGLTTTVDGAPIKGNTLKAELLAALEKHAQTASAASVPAQGTTSEAPASAQPAPTEPVAPAVTPAAVANPARTRTKKSAATESTEHGTVDTATGELLDPPAAEEPETTHEQAVATVTDQLGAAVIDDQATAVSPAETPAPEPAAAPAAAAAAAPAQAATAKVCEDCGKNLEGENPDYMKLAWIKYRKRLCESDYQKRKTGPRG